MNYADNKPTSAPAGDVGELESIGEKFNTPDLAHSCLMFAEGARRLFNDGCKPGEDFWCNDLIEHLNKCFDALCQDKRIRNGLIELAEARQDTIGQMQKQIDRLEQNAVEDIAEIASREKKISELKAARAASEQQRLEDQKIAQSVTDESCKTWERLHGEQKARADQAEQTLRTVREVLEWYGEQARLARIVHNEGDAGRHALSADGGKRARAALTGAGEK
jgi:hypothetical protein